MQTQEEIDAILNDTIWYVASSSIKHAPEIGAYVSYDVAAFSCSKHDIVTVVWDVTTDRKAVVRIIDKLNKHRVPPEHLYKAIRDMIR